MAVDHPVGSAPWWLARLHAQLQARQPSLEVLQRYADGYHDDPPMDAATTRAFRRLTGLTKTNFTGLVVESTADRFEVQGFQFGEEPDADADAWRMWEHSDFDTESSTAIRAALTFGRSMVSVEPSEPLPLLHAEDPRQVIVAYTPGRPRERRAALKEWVDDWTGLRMSTLYLPDRMYKFIEDKRGPVEVAANTPIVNEWRAANMAPGSAVPTRWAFRDSTANGEPNTVGVVPFFELKNRPRLDGDVMSEIEDVLAAQDFANHIAINAAIALEYTASPQKWATGLEVPRDPETGIASTPLEVYVNRLLVSEDPTTTFGQFTAGDLKPYVDLFKMTVENIASVTRIPSSYMLGPLVNLSAEALAAAEAGLVKKCKFRAKGYAPALVGAVRLAFALQNDARATSDVARLMWANMEIRSFAQQADAAVKLTQGDRPVLDVHTAQEAILGMSDTEQRRDEQRRGAQTDPLVALDARLNELAGGLEPPVEPPF